MATTISGDASVGRATGVAVNVDMSDILETLELAGVAKHAYVLAQAFNSFYHKYPVGQEDDPVVRRTRASIVLLYRARMIHLLALMGIGVPDRM